MDDSQTDGRPMIWAFLPCTFGAKIRLSFSTPKVRRRVTLGKLAERAPRIHAREQEIGRTYVATALSIALSPRR